MTLSAPTVHPLGEAAWTVVLGDAIDPGIHRRVLALAALVSEANRSGELELVPSYASLTVHFDPRRTDAAELSRTLLRAAAATADAAPDPAPARPPVVIPVRYDGADLGEVAERTGHTPEEVIRLHSEREYRVYLLGFAPGFAYLGDLDPALALPRRESPRPRVPLGAVAIAGRQTAVYPLSTPGGWHLIGTTGLRLFDPARQPPVLLAPGDRVRFVVAP